MRTYEPLKNYYGDPLPKHECVMEKYFDNAGIGCCAKRLANKVQDAFGCRWPLLVWTQDQEIEGQMRLNWTKEPELKDAFDIEELIAIDQRMLQNAY